MDMVRKYVDEVGSYGVGERGEECAWKGGGRRARKEKLRVGVLAGWVKQCL